MRLQTDICKDYFARNPKILERLNEVERMMGTEFNLECANSQYDTFDYTNKPIKFSWWIRFGSADMPVGLLNHYIDYPENNGINFSFVTWVEDELLRLCEPLREKLEEISNRIPDDKMETMTNSYQEVFDADDNLEYQKQWEIECGKVEKTKEQMEADELDIKEWNEYFETNQTTDIPDADRNDYILEGMTEEDIWGDDFLTITE